MSCLILALGYKRYRVRLVSRLDLVNVSLSSTEMDDRKSVRTESGKTQFLWFSTPGKKYLLNRMPISVSRVDIVPSANVRFLGVRLDEKFS